MSNRSDRPLISVLMTTFNRERYLAASIDSVLAQTFEDFELVIVDDASSDATVALARAYEKRDPRIRVLVNEQNLGQFPNRNHAARFTRGQYVKYHDSDDVMYPHCLATLLAGLVAYPAAGFAMTGSKYWSGGPCPMLLTPRLSYQREFLGHGLFMGGPACALFRTDVFQSLGGFAERGVFSDYLFWLHACARVSIVLVSGDLFWYRIHPGQELQSERVDRDSLVLSRQIWAALNAASCPLERSEREIAKANHAYVTAREAWRNVRGRRPTLGLTRMWTAGLTPVDWLRYLRPPRRSALAGTPLNEAGEYAMPAGVVPSSHEEAVAR
jgi:glycosyltransferase involved in cell wall biosynthesis